MKVWNSADPEPSDPFAQESIYNALDNCVTLEVCNELLPQLNEIIQSVYDFERELQAPVLEMMLRGVRIDLDTHDELIHTYQSQHNQLQEQLDEILVKGLGVPPINPGSWQQKGELLYGVLGLPPVRNRGKVTTNRAALEKLSAYFQAEPICKHIMDLQDVRKKLGFLKTGIGSDGRVRTTFSISGTDTGRLSSYKSAWFDGTNLQNVDPLMRKMFVADPGMKFAYIDLEQAEARLVGAILWNKFADPTYLDFCESGDLHTNVTKMTWKHLGWEGGNDRTIAGQHFYREFTYRDAAKRLGHASNYHGQPPQISREVRIPIGLVSEFQREYFNTFPFIPRWHEWTRNQLLRAGWITSALGRQRWFFGRRWDNETLNAAIAYDPQSSVADYLNRGLVRVWRSDCCQLLLQVHDAILIQYPEQSENSVIPRVRELLDIVIPLAGDRAFSIPSSASVGWNWGYAYNDKKELVNPNGLIPFTGSDKRVRQKSSVLDRRFR